jgi:tetratricopeptide (TPR) repeat protein
VRHGNVSDVRALALVVALVVSAPAVARAQSQGDPAPVVGNDEASARAREHSDIARGLYELGRYDEALREFLAGYAISPRPGFLIDLGQTYLQLHRFHDAEDMWRRYLAQTPPTDPLRTRVQELLAETERDALAAPQAEAPAPVVVSGIIEPSVPVRPSRARRNRLLAWTLPLSAVVLAGVAVGIYFGVRPRNDCSPASAGYCYDLRH